MKNHLFKDYPLELFKILLPALIGFGLGYLPFHQQYDATEKGKLNQDLNQLLAMNMQYSFVEDTAFIVRWDKHKISTRDVSSRDSSLKYEAYCTYVFNLLQNTAEYFHYDKEKISGFVDYYDLIDQHKGWWLRPALKNPQSYPKEFTKFVSDYIK
jgi:hypothetical protein